MQQTRQETPNVADSPINRATVATVKAEQLEKELDAIRERRLAMRLKVEAIAKVKGDKADLIPFMKFEKALTLAQKQLKKLDDDAEKMQQAVNKLRVLIVEMGV